MGQPTKFDGCNTVMRAPEGAENVQDMHVFRTRHSCVSCWEISPAELAEINSTGRVFLSVLMGGQQPPVYVGSESACRDVLVDFGPVWPLAPRTPSPSPDVAGGEPAAWLHPTAGWAHADYHQVRLHCFNDGPMPVPLYRAAATEADHG